MIYLMKLIDEVYGQRRGKNVPRRYEGYQKIPAEIRLCLISGRGLEGVS